MLGRCGAYMVAEGAALQHQMVRRSLVYELPIVCHEDRQQGRCRRQDTLRQRVSQRVFPKAEAPVTLCGRAHGVLRQLASGATR